MSGIKGKVALVTGSSRGIGKATALALGKEGAKVVVNYVKNRKKAQEVASHIKKEGGEAMIIKADVSSSQEVERMRNRVHEEMGEVTILVNNAGIHQHLKSWELSNED